MTFADVLRLTEAQTALAGNTLAVSRAFTSVFYDAGEKNENTPVSPAVCSPAYRLCRTASPFFCRHDRKRTAPPDIRAWLTPSGNQDDGISDTRRQMLTDAGRTLGFRGGKSQRSWELIQALNARESTLNALYDFRPLISKEGWLPPVIDEAQDVAHIRPDQIRTASRVWTILRPERFVSNPPWMA